MANALKTLFGDIASAIKEKTGDTATMKPAEFPAKIAAIPTGGGGSAAGAVTVTFCNYDGTELYSRQVFIGDDCPDPVTQGKMPTPTRESTAQYEYTHNGWSTTEGGTASTSALKNITADKTVYAAYSSAVRKYTVRFYDGSTLMKTESVAYGSQATPPSTVKDGYTFIAWQPSDMTITGDTDFHGSWIEQVSFSDSSWEKISEICENGKAAQLFSIGNEKTFESADGTSRYKIRIVGIGLDTKSDGSGNAGITVVLSNADGTPVLTKKTFGPSNWTNSYIRTSYCRGTIYNSIPSDLQSVIKTVSKRTQGYYEDTIVEETIFVPSQTELGGYESNGYTDDGIVYPGLDTREERNFGANYWWTRTVTNKGNSAWIVSSQGYVYDGYNEYLYISNLSSTAAIVPCFCI